MGKFRDKLLVEHKGKTMTASAATILAALVSLAPSGTPFIPATQAYVDAKVTQATIGLPYLVKSQIEHDVDGQWYLVYCMNRYDMQSALSRLVDQYRDLTGKPYEKKDCGQLEEILQVKRK